MRSPAAAIAWELCRRHRWGLAAVGLYFAVLAAIRLLVLGPTQRVTFAEDWQFALVVIVPLAATFTYVLGVFTFGLAGDLAAQESIYPAWMFTRPVTNATLAGWPMLYGALAMAVVWTATRRLAIWPVEAHVPWIWPALLATVLLAWTQALTWMPYPLKGLRVVLTVLWQSVIGFAVLVALEFKAPEGLMVTLLVPHLPVAYLVALLAVTRARRGETSIAHLGQFRGVFPPRSPRRSGVSLPRSPRQDGDHWPSSARAQLWLEWRRYGRSLPMLVGILLPFELSLLFVFRGTSVFVVETLAAVLLTPPFMAAFVAAAVRSSPGGRDAYELTPFIAARPLTNAALVRAKLEATIRSTLATWLLVLVATPLALELSDNWSAVADLARQVVEIAGTPRAVVFAVLALAALVAATWKQLVQSLYIGLSGRAWLVKASVFVTLAVLTILVPLVPWVLRRGNVISWLWDSLPWYLAILVCGKILAAAWIARRLTGSRLLRDRTLLIGALSWSVAVLALYSLLVWLLPTVIFPTYLLALVAILAIPLARLSAAPLALARNRHR